MTLLTWNHACTVGVRAMDDQHGILMDTMTELRLALVQGSGREQISLQLNRLIEFAVMHFASEETLLERFGFPGAAAHRVEHQRVLDWLRASAHRAERREDTQMRPLLGFLRDWLVEHIAGLDREYGAWLNERGVF